MTTTDLMIGNWVLDTRINKPLRVNPFMSELEVPTWRPIPITQRILEINGFTKPHYGQTYKWESLDGFIIFVGLESNSITIYYGCRKFIYSSFADYIPLHYLQNHITLCGIKKNIIL